MTSYVPLHLRETQIDNFNREVGILSQFHGCINTSPMGCGKTVTTNALSIYYNLPMAVVATKSGKQPWYREQQRYGTRLIDVITYQSLRSVKGKQPKHGLLHRIDERDDEGNEKVTFVPTPYLLQLIDQGILFVMDEVQKIKNNSDQYKACRAITHAILASGKSRFICLSGSPFDKEEHAVNLLRLMGFIRSTRLFVYHKESNDLRLYGAQELIDVCNMINANATAETLANHQLNPRTVQELCFKLYVSVIKPALQSSMDAPVIDAVKDAKNGYYNLPTEEAEELERAISDLGTATRYNENGGTIDRREVDWGALTLALRRVELAKINLCVRLSREVLRNDPNAQAIIFVSYVDAIRRAALALDEFRPLLLYGETSEKERLNVVNLFQANDDRYRLLIGNIKVGGDSIDLHDTHGGRTRHMFVVPNYSIIDLHQASGRIYRDGSRSNAIIRFVYGKVGRQETSILSALARKGEVMHKVVDMADRDPVLLPSEYPEYTEPDPVDQLTTQLNATTIA